MPFRTSPLYPLASGLDLSKPAHRLPPGFSPRQVNVRLREGAVASKRPGTRAFVDAWQQTANGAAPGGGDPNDAVADGTITGLFEYRRENGIIEVVAMSGGASLAERRIYRYTTTKWANITDATLTNGAGSDDINGNATDTWDATVAPTPGQLDNFYASNGHATTGFFELIKWTGTGNAVAMQAGPGVPRYLATFGNRLVLGHVYDGTATRGNRIAWSAYGDADTWSGAGSGAIDLIDTPDNISRLLLLRGRLIVYKERSLYIMEETGLNAVPFGFTLVSRDVGCPAGFSVASIGSAHLFLGDGNVYAFDAASNPQPIGEPIRKELERINPAAMRQVFSMVDFPRSEYWLFVPEGTDPYPNAAWVFNWMNQTWTRWEYPFQLTAGSRGIATTSIEWGGPATGIEARGDKWSEMGAITWAQMITTGASNLLAANADKTTEEITTAVSNDGSAAIDAFWESPDIDFAGQPGQNKALSNADLKTLTKVEVRSRGGGSASSLTCEVSTDGGTTFSTTSPNPVSVPATGGLVTFFTWLTGRTFRIRLRNNTAGQPLPSLEEALLSYIPRDSAV